LKLKNKIEMIIHFIFYRGWRNVILLQFGNRFQDGLSAEKKSYCWNVFFISDVKQIEPDDHCWVVGLLYSGKVTAYLTGIIKDYSRVLM
jgi:hypothetical protein